MLSDDLSIIWCRNDVNWIDNFVVIFNVRNIVKFVILVNWLFINE